jgi:hypothetical protein
MIFRIKSEVMRTILGLILIVTFAVTTSFNIKRYDKPIDYLNTGSVLLYNKIEYKLSWSSHPVSNFYKQEYIPEGETSEKYSNMLLVDFLLIDTPARNIVGLKVNELDERKKTDMVANYLLRENKAIGEFLLDFILSSGDADHVNVVEFNGYRYSNHTDKTGHKGVLLFGVSTRAYGVDVTPFLTNLKNNRNNMLTVLTQYEIPAIAIK